MTHHDIAFLKGPRVTLSPLHEDDAPLLTKWINDEEIRQYLGAAYRPKTEDDERAWIRGLPKQQNEIVCAIRVGEQFIGVMGIHQIDMRNGTAITGAIIGEHEYQSKGYGGEAKMLLLNYAFNTLRLRKMCSSVIAFNDRSLRYSLRCGYTEEGRLKAHLFRGGRYWDEVLLAVFKEDWEPLWEKFVAKHNLRTFPERAVG